MSIKQNRTMIIGTVLFLLFCNGWAHAETELQRKIDSLFVIASSGELKYRDLVDPAIDSIAALGAPAVPFLVDKFTTKSARERWTIIWILQRIGKEAVPYLIESLHRPNGLIVQRVCWALGDIKDTSAVEPLINITGHTRWQVREQALGALGKIGDNRADEVVIRGIDDVVPQVRKSAVVACGQLKITRAIRKLVHRLGDDFYGARFTAEWSLLKLDTAMVLQAISDSINSVNELLGNVACDLLGKLGTDSARELLAKIALSSESPSRRAHAAVSLVRTDPLDNCGYRARILQNETDRLVRLKIESAVTAANSHDTE